MKKKDLNLDEFFNISSFDEFNKKVNPCIQHNIEVANKFRETFPKDKNFFLEATEILTTSSDDEDYNFTYKLHKEHFELKIKNLEDIFFNSETTLQEKQALLEDNKENIIKSIESKKTLPFTIIFFSQYVDAVVSNAPSKTLKLRALGLATLEYFSDPALLSRIDNASIRSSVTEVTEELKKHQQEYRNLRRPQFSEYCSLLRLRFIFAICFSLNISFGLLLGHSIASTFRDLALNDHASSNQLADALSKAKNYNSFISLRKDYVQLFSSFSLTLKKTDFREKVCNSLFQLLRNSFHLLSRDVTHASRFKSVIDKLKALILDEINSLYTFNKQEREYIKFILCTFDDAEDPSKINPSAAILNELLNSVSDYAGSFVLNLMELSGLFLMESITTADEKQGVKTTGLITVKPNFIKDFFAISYCLDKYPMLVEPEPWVMKRINQSETLSLGGFSINKNDILPGIHVFTENYASNNLALAATTANYLQKTAMKINKEFLYYILKNFSFFLKEYLNLSEADEKALFTNSINLTVVSEIDFVNSKCGPIVAFTDKSEYKKQELKRSHEHVLYKVYISQIFNFINSLFVSFFFKDFIIWTPYILDFRLRLYPTGIISTQGSNLVKSLLEMFPVTPEHQKHLKTRTAASESYFKLQVASWESDYKKSRAKIFTFKKAEKCIFSTTVELDVSASGIQILAGLIGDIDALIKTNFLIPRGGKKSTVKEDIYLFFADAFVDKISRLAQNQLMDDKLFLKFSKSVLTDIIKTFDRKFVKSFLMCYFYSEGSFSRVQKLEESLLFSRETLLLKSSLISKGQKEDVNKFIHNLKYKICNETFEETVKENLFDIYRAKDTLESLVNNSKITDQKGIDMKISSHLSYAQIFYLVVKYDVKTVSYYSAFHNKSLRYHLRIATDDFDKRKARSKIVPNLIHRLDSEILMRVVFECKKRGIPLFTAHDCFSTYSFYIQDLKKYYFEAFCNVCFDNNVLETFIKENSTVDEFALFQNFLKTVKENNETCKKKITAGEFIMSEFILTP